MSCRIPKLALKFKKREHDSGQNRIRTQINGACPPCDEYIGRLDFN
jgi:hypothetical protein